MGAVTPKFHFGFTLAEGPSNIVEVPEAASQRFKRGDLVKLSSGKVAQFANPFTTGTTTVSAGIFGVAAKDAVNNTLNAYTPVHRIVPEQIWKVHCLKGVKPSTKATLDEGKSVKLKFLVSSSYTISDGNSNTTQLTVAGWMAVTTAVQTLGSNLTGVQAYRGVRVVGYPDRVGGTKGGIILVNFNTGAIQGA